MARKIAIIVFLCLAAPGLAGCDAFDKKARSEYEAATKRWNAGDYPGAVAQYTALAKKHPFSPYADNALYWAGTTQFLYLGETDKALKTLQFLLKKYPRRDMAPSAQLTIAQIYELGYNDYERAIAEYRKASAYSDRMVREKGLYSLGDNLFRLGRIDEAKEVWARQVAEFPKGAQAELGYFRLGTTAFSQGTLDEAETYYRKSLDVSTDSGLAVKTKFALAGCLEAGDELGEALKLYKEIEPEYPNRDAIQIKIKGLEERIKKKSY